MYKVKLQLDAEVEAAYGLDKMAGWRKEEEAWLDKMMNMSQHGEIERSVYDADEGQSK